MAQSVARSGRVAIVSSVATDPATVETWVSDAAGFDTRSHTEHGRTYTASRSTVLLYQSPPPTNAAAVGTNDEQSAEANGRTPSRQSKNQE
jgi:hypothetical protein